MGATDKFRDFSVSNFSVAGILVTFYFRKSQRQKNGGQKNRGRFCFFGGRVNKSRRSSDVSHITSATRPSFSVVPQFPA